MCQWGRARQGVGCQVRFVCSCSGAVHATARAQKHCQTNLKCHALRPQPACCQNRVENENCRETPRAPCFPVPVGVRSYRLPRPSPRRVEKPRPNNGGVEHEREDARLLARAQNHDETQTGGTNQTGKRDKITDRCSVLTHLFSRVSHHSIPDPSETVSRALSRSALRSEPPARGARGPARHLKRCTQNAPCTPDFFYCSAAY